jgi:predicted DCC family thiol-disulfide oxidoreductase YuxK
MSDRIAQPTRTQVGPHLLLYDGVCGLCDRLVQFVLERDRRGVFRFASLQSLAATKHLARFGARAGDIDTLSVITDYQTETSRRLTRARAAVCVLSNLGCPWRAVALVGVLPSALLERAYDLVAANRYRLFGRRDHCVLPRPEYVHRFLDAESGVPSTPGVWP